MSYVTAILIQQTWLDEIRTRPPMTLAERGGCPCSSDRMVPPLRGATRLRRVPGLPPSG